MLVVFILLLFNLGGWFVWQVSRSRLDEQLDGRLLEQGRALRVYLESLQADDDDSGSELLEATLYLQRVAEESPLHRLFLISPEGWVLFDSLEEVDLGQKEPLLEADEAQLRRLWQGQFAATTFYPTGDGYAKRGYVPIRSSEGQTIWGLVLETGSSAFVGLEQFRRAMSTLSLASVGVAVLAVLVLAQVVRRARRLEEIMARTERAIEAGRLTAALAHELRNPLGIIQTNAEVLLAQLPSEAQESARDILGEVDRLSATIARFLDLSSQKPGEWISYSLGEVAASAAGRHRSRLAGKGIEIECDRPERGDEIEAQVDRLESVFDNLLSNAEHALEGRKGGRIKIEVRPTRRGVSVEVRDNGPGFSGEALKMALQPFYSDRATGAGIGLAIARRIVEDHGGTLTLKNRFGGGAVVQMVFPKKR